MGNKKIKSNRRFQSELEPRRARFLAGAAWLFFLELFSSSDELESDELDDEDEDDDPLPEELDDDEDRFRRLRDLDFFSPDLLSTDFLSTDFSIFLFELSDSFGDGSTFTSGSTFISGSAAFSWTSSFGFSSRSWGSTLVSTAAASFSRTSSLRLDSCRWRVGFGDGFLSLTDATWTALATDDTFLDGSSSSSSSPSPF